MMNDEMKKRIFLKLTSSRFMAFFIASFLFTLLLVTGHIDQTNFVELGKWLLAGLFGAKGLEKLTNFKK